MGKPPRIPSEFRKRPFTLDEARAAGLTRHCLRGKSWRRLGSGLYCWSDLADNPWLTLSACRRTLPSNAVFIGATAAYLHGLDLEPTDSIEVAVPRSSGLRTRKGLVVRHCDISPADVVSIKGLLSVTLPLTLAGLCLQLPPGEALVAIDSAVRKGLTDPAALCRYADAACGRPGAARLRWLATLAAPAESPMETRLRWLLLESGLPKPQVQVDIRDGGARFLGRADLCYSESRLLLEYDGGNHRDRLVEDNRRQNLLVSAGYRLLRFTAADIYSRQDVVVAQVRAALKRPSRTETRFLRKKRV